MLFIEIVTMFIAKFIELFAKAVPIIHEVIMVLQHPFVQFYADELIESNVSVGLGVARVQTCSHAQMTLQPTHCTTLGENDV